MSTRRSQYSTMAVLSVGGFLLAITSVAVAISVEQKEWINIPLHSAIEVFAAFAAIALGLIIVFLQKESTESISQGVWVASGLLTMGTLDVFHGSIQPGAAFVWLRSTASFAGGLLFSMVWLQNKLGWSETARKVPWAVISLGAIFGSFSAAFPEALPAMTAHGGFTHTAVAINIAGGILFLAAAPRFFISYWAKNSRNDLVFGCFSLLLGIAGLLFELSKPWLPSWWYWHFLRLLAFVSVFVYTLVFFRMLIPTITSSIGAISSTAVEISSTVTQHERTATLQAAIVNETTATVDELSASSRQSADQAASAAEIARQASALIDEGNEIVEEAIEGMRNLKERVDGVSAQILRLGEQMGQIGSIANLVGDLASETKMLALNAAVEAVHAGQQGKGFAVVASEVRKLADQSKKSAEQANMLIADIQKATNATIMVTEEGAKTVDEVTNLAQKVGKLFGALAGAAGSVYENAQQVLLNARQQSSALGQVLEAVNGINKNAKETAAGITQTKIGMENLTKVAQDLQALV